MAVGGAADAGSSSRGGSAGSSSKSEKSDKAEGYSKADRQAKANDNRSDKKSEQKSANGQNGREATVEQQGQSLRDFDKVQGRPPVGEQPGRHGETKDGFGACAGEAAKDVVVGTVKEAYEFGKDGLGSILDQVGVDGYEGHTERMTQRGEAAIEGAKKTWDAVTSPIETVGKIKDATINELGEIKDEIKNGESCKLGERVGTAAGVGVTMAVPGGAIVKGGKILGKMGSGEKVDGPENKTGLENTEKVDKSDSEPEFIETRTHKNGVEYTVTRDRPEWGRTERETRSVDEAIEAKSKDKDDGVNFEADTATMLQKNDIEIKEMGRKEYDISPNENDVLGEIDIETENHTIEVKKGKFRTSRIRQYAELEQLHRGKQPVLFAPGENVRASDIAHAKAAGFEVATSSDQLIAILNQAK